MGPVGKIIVNSAYPCKEKPENDDVVVKGEIKSMDDKGTKNLFATMDTKVTIDDTYNASFKLITIIKYDLIME